MVELALITPVLMLLLIGIADFGRIFTVLVGTESAAREAADYGAFLGSDRWNPDTTVNPQYPQNWPEMRARACSAAAQLPDYIGDPVGTPGMDCSNPAVVYELVVTGSDPDCHGRSEHEGPCLVKVTVDYDFAPILKMFPFPESIRIHRESVYAISDLPSP